MEILRFLFFAFLIYLAFRLLFDFIIPIYRTTRRIRKGFREMHEKMNQQTNSYHKQENYSKHNSGNNKNTGGAGDYIDFEEIKD